MNISNKVFAAIITPFNCSGDLDLEFLPAFLDFQRECGVNGILAAGTTGEGPSLSLDERKRLLGKVISLRGDFDVFVGTGACSLPDAIYISKYASDLGADALLALPPFFFRNASPRGVADYFLRLLDSSPLPVLLYNIPQFTGIDVTWDVPDIIGSHPNLIGMKDSGIDTQNTLELIRHRKDLHIYIGNDSLIADGLAAGAQGVISGIASAFPDIISGVVDVYESREDAQGAQHRLNDLLQIIARYPAISVFRSILAFRGMKRTWARPPLVDLTNEQAIKLRRELEAYL
jgi:dihydrodipicolinate synthase/N-acetylneuraminate lyase